MHRGRDGPLAMREQLALGDPLPAPHRGRRRGADMLLKRDVQQRRQRQILDRLPGRQALAVFRVDAAADLEQLHGFGLLRPSRLGGHGPGEGPVPGLDCRRAAGASRCTRSGQTSKHFAQPVQASAKTLWIMLLAPMIASVGQRLKHLEQPMQRLSWMWATIGALSADARTDRWTCRAR